PKGPAWVRPSRTERDKAREDSIDDKRLHGAGVGEAKGRVERWRGGLGRAFQWPALSSAGAKQAQPCPVSTSRSSNRTCGFAASGSPTGFRSRHTGQPASRSFADPRVPSVTAES